MHTRWDRIAAIVFSGTAWALALVAGSHMAHALRHPARLMAHASIGRRRDLG